MAALHRGTCRTQREKLPCLCTAIWAKWGLQRSCQWVRIKSTRCSLPSSILTPACEDLPPCFPFCKTRKVFPSVRRMGLLGLLFFKSIDKPWYKLAQISGKLGCQFSVHIHLIFLTRKCFYWRYPSDSKQGRKRKKNNPWGASTWAHRRVASVGTWGHTPQRHYPHELGSTAVQPTPLYWRGVKRDFAKSIFCFKAARRALISCYAYSHPCSSGSRVGAPCGSVGCSCSCSLQCRQLWPQFQVSQDESSVSLDACVCKWKMCYGAIYVCCNLPSSCSQTSLFCRTAENTALNFRLQRGVGLSSGWD